MRIAINAIPIRPGGGLTVVCGLVQSLRACRPAWHISVLTAHEATYNAVDALGAANEVRPVFADASAARALAWQCTQLGDLLRRRGADALVAFNHFQPRVACPQIVYHLNLRRFCRAYRSKRPRAILEEKLRDWLAQAALRRAAANVFESQYLLQAATDSTRREIRNPSVIYVGLPDRLLASAASTEAHSSAVPSRRMVAITSPEPHKDNTTLIRTLARLTRKAPQQDWHLDVVGGVDRAAWQPSERLAEGLGVRGRITWHGFCEQEKITELLRGALCLVSTSRMESFAMVALEAMARGCPPIVAECAAMPESIGAAGLLATPGKPAAFADAVLRLTTEAGLREQLVSRGYEWIQNFRWSECGASFAKSIEKLAIGRRTEGAHRPAMGAAREFTSRALRRRASGPPPQSTS